MLSQYSSLEKGLAYARNSLHRLRMIVWHWVVSSEMFRAVVIAAQAYTLVALEVQGPGESVTCHSPAVGIWKGFEVEPQVRADTEHRGHSE